jgi:hypothetical protein
MVGSDQARTSIRTGREAHPSAVARLSNVVQKELKELKGLLSRPTLQPSFKEVRRIARDVRPLLMLSLSWPSPLVNASTH